jgi:hypothetical protein
VIEIATWFYLRPGAQIECEFSGVDPNYEVVPILGDGAEEGIICQADL